MSAVSQVIVDVVDTSADQLPAPSSSQSAAAQHDGSWTVSYEPAQSQSAAARDDGTWTVYCSVVASPVVHWKLNHTESALL